ncbi:hypothetical protein FACS189463_3690 [Bacteroidia bacterium]|nr:hypothetical protein FACS189463_3690 [Bacteroidia bacterium]
MQKKIILFGSVTIIEKMKSKLKVFTVASVILLGCTLFAHTAQAQTVKEFPQKFILIRNSGDGPELRAYFTVQVRLGRALEYCDVEIKNVELGFYGNYTYKGVMYNAPHPAFAGSNSLDVENLSSAAAQVTVRVSFGSNDTHTKKLNLTGLGNLFQIEKNNKNRDIDDWWESVSVDIPGEGSYKGRDYEAERAIQQWLKAEEQKKTDAEKAKAAAEKARADAIDKALADKHRAEKETEAAEKELNEAKRNGDKAAETEAQKKIDEAQALSKQSYDREMDAKYQSPEDFMKSNAENRDNRQEDNYSNRSSSSSSSNSSDPCAHYAEVLGKAMEAGDRELAAEYSKLMHQCYDRQRQRKERVEHQARYNKMTPKQKATDDVFRGLQTLTQRIADELIQQAEESDRREAAARIERERQAEIQRENSLHKFISSDTKAVAPLPQITMRIIVTHWVTRQPD